MDKFETKFYSCSEWINLKQSFIQLVGDIVLIMSILFQARKALSQSTKVFFIHSTERKVCTKNFSRPKRQLRTSVTPQQHKRIPHLVDKIISHQHYVTITLGISIYRKGLLRHYMIEVTWLIFLS